MTPLLGMPVGLCRKSASRFLDLKSWELELELNSPSIEIILLDINPINRDPADLDIAVRDIRDETRRVVVALDPSSVLGIDDDAVFKLSNFSFNLQG